MEPLRLQVFPTPSWLSPKLVEMNERRHFQFALLRTSHCLFRGGTFFFKKLLLEFELETNTPGD